MYLTIAILGAGFFLALFSQFGSRLSARQALLWFCVGALVVSSALWPELYQRLAHMLGVSLGSNLIFAGLILLLIFLLVEQSAALNRGNRLVRDGATELAARAALENVASPWRERPGPRALVVLPAYNEAACVPRLVEELETLAQRCEFPLDYCFIDDGSEDGTEAALRRHAAGHFASHRLNMGVAAALLTGIKIAEGRGAEFLVQCDADGQHPVSEIPRLVAAAVAGGLDLTIGSRYAGEVVPGRRVTTLWRRTGTALISLAYRGFRLPAKIQDPTSGFRVYSKRALQYLARRMPEEYPEPETIALLAWAGMKIEEIPVAMSQRQEGVSTIRGFNTLLYMAKVMGALFGLRLRTLFSTLR